MKTLSIDNSVVSLKNTYVETLASMMREDSRVLHLDADMREAIGTSSLVSEFPDRIIDVGVMEANMIGIAAGLSILGKIPFVHSFGVFTTRRCADQVFLAGSYNKANVKILGTDPGIAAEHNGGTHMPLEDIGILRSIPDIRIFDIADPVLLEDIVRQEKDHYGMAYIRFPRTNTPKYYDRGNKFEIGKGNLLRTGSDVTIVASGMTVVNALEAADRLSAQGIEADVIDMFTIKPIDEALLCERLAVTGAAVCVENHNVIGGLGSAVAEVIAEKAPAKLVRLGSHEKFGEVGTKAYLAELFGITTDDIVRECKRLTKG